MLRERAYAISWEPGVCAPPETSEGALSAVQWSLAEALYELRLLTAGQIEREFLSSIGRRQIRRELLRLRDMGIIERGRLHCAHRRGQALPIYVLAKHGFALLSDASPHPASGHWRRPAPRGAPLAVHDLARNEWLFAFRSLAPRQLLGFRGPRRGRIKREDGSSIIPDLTLELEVETQDGGQIEADLLVEIEWGNNNETVRRKALAYDDLLNHWWREHPRYKSLGRPPKVCFAVPDLWRARRFIAILDKALQGHLLIPPHTQTRAENELGIVPTVKRLYLGRQNIFVVVARDVHQRTLRAWRVPAVPPEQRAREALDADEEREAASAIPRRAQLLRSRELVDPAT